MALDLDKMAKARAAQQRGGDYWKPENGEHLLYLHPPCREADEHAPTAGLNYVELYYHYSVGKTKISHVCLDAELNPVVKHPFVQEFLKKKGVKVDLTKGCDTCKEIAAGSMSEVDSKECRSQVRFVWGLTPFASRKDASAEWAPLPPKPSIYSCGKMVYEGIMEVFSEYADITDPEKATFIKLVKTGKGKTGTKYAVTADAKTARAPVKLDKGVMRLLKDAIKPDGDCDLFRVVAGGIKSQAEIRAALNNVKVEDDTGGDGEDAEGD